MDIRLNVSNAYLNKELKPGFKRSAKSYSFKRSKMCLGTLAAHIKAGGAFAMSLFSEDRRHSDFWLSSQLLALDLDNKNGKLPSLEEIANMPFIREYAYLVYETPSSTPSKPKIRVLFVLSEAVDNPDAWRALQRAVITHNAHLEPDESCKDLARYFAGSTQPGHIILGNLLPLEIAGALTVNEARAVYQAYQTSLLRKQEAPQQAVSADNSDAERITATCVNKALATLAAASHDRHAALIKTAGYLHSMAKGQGWTLTAGDVDRWLMDACQSNGYVNKVGESEVQRCIDDMRQIAVAKDFEPRLKRRAQKQQAQDTRKTVQHISDDLPPDEIAKYRTLLIEGGTGLGKTRAGGDYANSLLETAKITFMAQFRLLVQGARKYIQNADHYEDATGNYQSLLSSVARLLTSVSSSPKFDRNNSDLLMLDELAGVLNFVVSSDTFKRDESVIVYRTLKHWIASAVQLIGMDANLSSIEIDWINSLRGNDATVKTYRRPDTRGMVTLLKDSDTALWQVKKLLMHKRGQVYLACSSEKKSSAAFDLFSGGEYRVFKITRDTSNTSEVEQFIESEDYRAQFDLVIYDPAMGSGVDISESVYALVGIFDRMPLAPESAIQLYGRVRNAERYYAAVPAESEGYETPTAEQIKIDRLNREYWTAKHTGQVVTQSGAWLEMLDLWSKYQERHLREVARWRLYFVERLKHNGFKVQWHDVGISKALRAAFTAWRKERKENDNEFVLGAVGLALDDSALEKIRLRRQEITHEHRLCNTRYKIENVLGSEDVSERDIDLMSPQNRGALYRAIQRRNEDTLEFDANESVDGVPLQKRRYSHLELTAASQLLTKMGFVGKPAEQDEAILKFFLQERPDTELKERFAVLTSDECTKLFKMLGHQTENANTALGRLKWILNYLWGVKPQSRRVGRDENRMMFYRLDSDVIDYLIARRDRAALAARVKQAEKCTTNLLNKRESRFVVHPPQPIKEPEKQVWMPHTPTPYHCNVVVTEAA